MENKEGNNKYYQWHLEILDKEDYPELVDKKYEEILKEVGGQK